jgi:hypothetical protein
MSEHEYGDRGHAPGTSYGPGGLLTPRACAIAGFAFAAFSMLGQGTWSLALQALVWGSTFQQSQIGSILAGWALATLILAGVAWLLARRTLADPVAAGAWDGHLARAAVLVAAAGAVFSVIGLVGGLVH